MSERHARFFATFLLSLLFRLRIGRNERSSHLVNAVFLDQAKWIVSSLRNEALGFPMITSLLSQSREIGMGFVIADQQVDDLDRSVLVNSRAKLCMRLGDGKDIRRMADAMSLKREQAELIPRLKMRCRRRG